MIWVFSIVSQVFFGTFLALRFSPPDAGVVLALGFGVPIGFSFSCFSFFFLSAVFGQNVFGVVANIAVMCLLSFAVLLLQPRKAKRISRFSAIDAAYAAVWTVAPLSVFFLVYFRTPERLPNLMGAFFHEDLSFTASFYTGCNSGLLNPFSMRHPDVHGESIASRWLPSFHSSMLMLGMSGLRLSLIVPSALMFASFSIIMQHLMKKFKVPAYVYFPAPLVAFSIGGFSFFNLYSMIQHRQIGVDYISQTPTESTVYLHPHLHVLFASRSVLYAASITLAVVATFFMKHAMILKIVVCFSAGMMLPATIGPAFYAMLMFMAIFFALDIKKFQKLPFLFFLIGGLMNMHRLHMHVHNECIWDSLTLRGSRFPLFEYFFYGCGFFIPIAMISFFFLEETERKIWISLFITFITFSRLSFNVDSKLDLLLYFAFFVPIAVVFYATSLFRLASWFENDEVKGIIAASGVIITAISCTSSIAGTFKMLRNKQTVYTEPAIQLGRWIIKNTKPGSVFMGQRQIMDPVSTIAGRQVYIPNSEIAIIEGYNITQKEVEYTQFLSHSGDKSVLPVIDYIVRGKGESLIEFNFPDENAWTETYFTNDVIVFKRQESNNQS